MVRVFGTDAPDAVYAFLDEDVSPRGREHWQWKYRIGSDGPPRAFYWQDADGGIVGFIGLMHTTLHTAAALHPAAWFVDWHVRPGGAGVGVGIGLLRKAEAAAGILLTLQGSADTQKILPRLGWKQSSSPATWVRPVSAPYLARWIEQRTGASARGAARVPAAIAARLLSGRPSAPPPGATLVDIDRFPDQYDAVWGLRAAESPPAMRRDSDYLNYLCADYPGGGYRLQLVNLQDEAVGHMISRMDRDKAGLNRGRIVDLVWPAATPDLGRWMVQCACTQFERAGADYIEGVASTPSMERLLEQFRFRRRRRVPIWHHRLGDDIPDPGTWQVTLLDCDRAYR